MFRIEYQQRHQWHTVRVPKGAGVQGAVGNDCFDTEANAEAFGNAVENRPGVERQPWRIVEV